MAQNIYIARQPIVDINENIKAYELLFRSAQQDGSILSIFEDNLLATTRVLVNTLNHIGIKNLIGEYKAFINVDEEMLLDNMITTVPKEKFVIELLETINITDELIDRIKELKDMGYSFALDDAHCETRFLENFLPIFPYLDVLKLDTQFIDTDILKERIEEFKKFDFAILAEKVETQEEFELYKALGCELFQGYYFAKPKIISQKALDPHYKNIFKLIKLLDEDTDLEKLINAFEQQADITVQLLRFMNSGQLNLKSDISSIKHAISLLGKLPLKQWLLLIAYSKSDYSSNTAKVNSPILNMAASRAQLMYELMDALHQNKNLNHEAAFVGLLSLLPSIIHAPIENLLNELHVNKKISEAILENKGELGLILELAIAVEHFQLEDANNIVQNLNISQEKFRDALIESMHV